MPYSESNLPMSDANFAHSIDIWSATYQVIHGPRNSAEISRRPLRNQNRLPSLGSILLPPRITQGSKRHLSGGSQTVVRVSDAFESAKRYSIIGNKHSLFPVARVSAQHCCTRLQLEAPTVERRLTETYLASKAQQAETPYVCQARSQSAEVQLARATTELTGLRTRQAALESRNVFLENLATLHAPAQVQVSGLTRCFADDNAVSVIHTASSKLHCNCRLLRTHKQQGMQTIQETLDVQSHCRIRHTTCHMQMSTSSLYQHFPPYGQ